MKNVLMRDDELETESEKFSMFKNKDVFISFD